jgi:dihydrodipicolinate synthase/N-acetylneuraminate lyase
VKGFTSGIVNFMPRTPLPIMELLCAGQLKAAAEVVEGEAMPVFDLRGKRPGYTTVVIKEGITLLWPGGRAAAPTPRPAR